MTSPTSLRPPDPDDLLFRPSKRYRTLSFKADHPPIEYRGLTVVSKETVQDTKDDPNNPERSIPAFWPSGDPIWVIVYGLQLDPGFRTDPRIVEEYGDDNGLRYLWVTVVGTWVPGDKDHNQYVAIQDAVKRAGRRKVDLGGRFDRFAFVRNGPPPRDAKRSPAKFYEVDYTPAPEGYVPQAAAGAPQGAPHDDGDRGYDRRDPYAGQDIPPPEEPPF